MREKYKRKSGIERVNKVVPHFCQIPPSHTRMGTIHIFVNDSINLMNQTFVMCYDCIPLGQLPPTKRALIFTMQKSPLFLCSF